MGSRWCCTDKQSDDGEPLVSHELVPDAVFVYKLSDHAVDVDHFVVTEPAMPASGNCHELILDACVIE